MGRPIWPKSPPGLVRRLLEGHKILGLALAGVLYLICLTGWVGVYYVEFERWERPNLPEFSVARPEAAGLVIADARRVMLADTHRGPLDTDLYLGLPTEAMPRMIASYGHDARAYDAEGRYAGDATHDLTHFLTELHYYLHLPESFGMIVVCLFGVGMMALLIGGAAAHPRMFRDAFLLRPRKEGQLGRADVHNRLGTWTLPFALAITLTGTMIGLGQLVALVVGHLAYGGDTLKIYDPVFGSQAEITAATGGRALQGDPAILNALRQIRAAEPDQPISFVVIHSVGTPQESIEITTKPPHRLVYGEIWRFNAAGDLAGSHNLSDGPAGRQIAASLYSLHFGDFGGQPVKLIYALLGLALTVMIAAGMDIWLIKSAGKGRPRPSLHRLWIALVYGAPAAIAATFVICMPTGIAPVPLFWGLMVALGGITLVSMRLNDAPAPVVSRLMRRGLGVAVIAMPVSHWLVHRSVTLAALQLSIPLVLIGLALIASTRGEGSSKAAVSPVEAP